MKKKMQKIAVCCLVSSLTFMANPVVMKAAEIPLAGIDVLLSDFYESETGSGTDVNELLSPEDTEYKDLAIAQVSYYVNIRKKANTESEILGKLYNDSAATILAEEGEWYKVKSGSVTGYIKAEFLVTGEPVEELAEKVGTKIATVNTTTLKVRQKAGLDAVVETLIPEGEELTVKKELDGWAKVVMESGTAGYVSTDYIEISTEFEEAESVQEEKARLEAEAKAEAARQEALSQEAQSTASGQSASGAKKTVSSQSTSDTPAPPSSSDTSSARSRIVEYALRFAGNPYKWGGTSLTNGADCSGFTQSVFRDNGVSISRTSRTQAAGGRTVSVSNMQAGDLVFYERGGRINHVAIYIGNGKVISASNEKYGIRVSSYNYRQPCKVVSYLN